MSEKDNKSLVQKEKKVRILWKTDDDVPAVYANHLYVSHSGGTEFNLTFGHLSPPIIAGLEDDEIPENVYVQPIAKIILSPDVMRSFVEVLQENLKGYERSKKEGEK